MDWPAALCAAIVIAGLIQVVAGWLALRRFRRIPAGAAHPRPPVTILKPLYGNEPLLEQALASNCVQAYPDWQIVFGVHDQADSALPVVQRLIERFPERDISVVVDATQHGANRKVSNLINMFPFARHDVIVIADSDVHVTPDYLDRLAAALARPGVGVVTALYAGLAATGDLAGRLGASFITGSFVPGALLARAVGRQDCLGATMALTRETLASIGGLRALSNHLADDAMLGILVRARGLNVGLAGAVLSTTVPETRLGPLFRHELRWARTILAIVPVGFALSAIQFPLAWALLAILLSGSAIWSVLLFLGAWAIRAAAAAGIDASLGLASSGRATPAPLWLLPLRDLMSLSVLFASFFGNRVEWRGHTLRARAPSDTPPNGRPPRPAIDPADQPT